MFNFCVVMQLANFSNIKYDIPELKGDNYKVWKERILLHLGCMDIDYAIRKDKETIIDTSTTAEKALYEQWEQSNRLSLMFIKTKISYGICGSVDQHDNVKALLKVIDEQFVTLDKALASQHLDNEVFILKAHRCEWCVRAHNANEGYYGTIEDT